MGRAPFLLALVTSACAYQSPPPPAPPPPAASPAPIAQVAPPPRAVAPPMPPAAPLSMRDPRIPLTSPMHTPECVAEPTPSLPDECWIVRSAAEAALAAGYGNDLVVVPLKELSRKQIAHCTEMFGAKSAERCGDYYGRKRRTTYWLSVASIGRAGDIWVVEFPSRQGEDTPPLRVTVFYDGGGAHVDRPRDWDVP